MRFPIYLTLCAALAAPVVSGAASIDGVAPVICASLEAVQCMKAPGARHACARGPASALNVPQFVRLDFANKKVTATKEGGEEKSSTIASVSRGNGHIIVQGVDNGRGWSLVLEENTGRMAASVVADEEGMIVFGACTQI